MLILQCSFAFISTAPSHTNQTHPRISTPPRTTQIICGISRENHDLVAGDEHKMGPYPSIEISSTHRGVRLNAQICLSNKYISWGALLLDPSSHSCFSVNPNPNHVLYHSPSSPLIITPPSVYHPTIPEYAKVDTMPQFFLI
jgi:hypothetical protein